MLANEQKKEFLLSYAQHGTTVFDCPFTVCRLPSMDSRKSSEVPSDRLKTLSLFLTVFIICTTKQQQVKHQDSLRTVIVDYLVW